HFHAAVSDHNSILARPIINGTTGLEDAVLTASATRNGSIDAFSDAQLTSTGILYRALFWSSPVARIDSLAGYRHTHLFDRVRTDEAITALAGDAFAVGTHVTRVDQFRTVNQFDGADLGLRGWWSNDGKLALTGISK